MNAAFFVFFFIEKKGKKNPATQNDRIWILSFVYQLFMIDRHQSVPPEPEYESFGSPCPPS